MPRRPLLATALSVLLSTLLISAGPAGASMAPLYDRIYLLGADTDYLYWSVDPFDPELGAGTIRRTCGVNVSGVPGYSKPCLVGTHIDQTTRSLNVYFSPASLLHEKISWSVASPLRFHIEGVVNTFGAPYTVHFLIQKGTEVLESPSAAEVAPGVWEGSITTGSPMSAGTVNLLGVRIKTLALAASIELRSRGGSYLELPQDVAARGVPDLIRDDTYWPQPSSFASATRSFTFNDADWTVRSFTGETGPRRTYGFELGRKAEMLLAWVEVFDSSFFEDVRRGRPPNPQKVRQGAGVTLTRNGETIEHSGFSGAGVAGFGSDGLAVLDLTAGPLELEVDSANEDEADSMPFKVYVLEIGGERTLRTMRWQWMHVNSFRLPIAALCPASLEALPATQEVRSIALDLDWQTEAVGMPEWTLRYALPGVGGFPCSEGGTGDRVRLTVPGAQVWYVGATPAYDASFFSLYDTTFAVQARFTYSPPSPA